MPPCTRNSVVFVLCLLGTAFCVNGFTLGTCSQSMHPSFSVAKQPIGSIFLTQSKQAILEDERHNTNYPADTLQNLGLNSTQTLAPDIAYFYLQNTLGLSEETMWKITLEAGSVLGMTPRNLENKVSLLRRTMNLSDEDVRVILGKQPAVLHYSAERNLAPTILFLVRALDLSKSELRRMILDCPSILGYSLGNLKKKLHFFWFTLEYSDCGEKGLDSVRELLVGTPKLLLSAVDTGLVPRMKFLLNEIQFSRTELRRLYEKNPRLLLYSVDGNLREKIVFFFILQLHMEPEHVRKILLSFPQVMDYNLENHMKPIAEYFLSELEFSAAELGSIIQKFPRIFSYSLKRIKHVIGFLRFELELDSRQAKRVIFQAPQVFGLGKMEEKLDFLRNHLDLSAEELGLVFSKMPTLMCLGVRSNLEPKLIYLEHALLADNQSLKETILKQPTLLGYSLQGRIQPRMERLIAAGISSNKITVGISMSESKFQQWLTSSQSRRMNYLDLHKDLQFSDDELNAIVSDLPEIFNCKVPSLQSWLSYLKGELGVSNAELKNTLMQYPTLLDGSSRCKIRHRLKKMRLADLSLLDYVDAVLWPGEKFDSWIRFQQARSEIEHLRKELKLNSTVTRILVSEMPALENTRSNKIFEQKLKFYMSEFGGAREDVISLLLGQPSLLNLSIKRVAEPRMRKIRLAGVSNPRTISTLIALANDDFLDWWRPIYKNNTVTSLRNQFPETVELLESTLNLNQEEADSVLLSLPNSTTARSDVEGIVDLLLGLADGDIERVKAAVLERTHLFSLTQRKMESRINELSSSVHTMEIMFDLVTMTEEDYETYLLLIIHQNMLNMTNKEIVSLVDGSRRIGHDTAITLATKIEYILSQGSPDDVKNAILSRPDLLSYSLKKLRNMSNVLGTTRSKYAVLRFENESRAILRDVIGLSEEDADFVLSHSRYLSLRDPEEFLLPKLSYLLSKFDGCKKHATLCVLENPGLLDYSLHDRIMPRMKLLIDAGLDPIQINEVISLSQHEIDERKGLNINMTDVELNHVIPLKAWLIQRHLRQSAKPVIEYLASQVNGSIKDLKQILLEEPKLLNLSLLKTIQPRMEMLTNAGSPPTDISNIAMLSQRKVEEYCTICQLCRNLGISSTQRDYLYGSVCNARPQSSRSLLEKVDYILHHVFGGSKQKLKAAILKEPELLKRSLKQTIQPRAEVLHLLESIGLEDHSSDMARFFTQPESLFTQHLVPKIENWNPSELDEKHKVKDPKAGNTAELNENDIIGTLKEFSLPLTAFVYSDEPNRDRARVVHWRR